MRPVIVLIFHALAADGAGRLVRALAETRRALAEEQRSAFLAAGADAVHVMEATDGPRPFGRRLSEAVRRFEPAGVVVLGSGSIPLAQREDFERFVQAAAQPGRLALSNNRYSSDVVAVSDAGVLADLPDLPSDNAIPRWLDERAGFEVQDLRHRWHLAADIDSPADLVLLASAGPLPAGLHTTERVAALDAAPLAARVRAVCEVLSDRRAELLVAGRVSVRSLAALEAEAECRVRALVEERGLRASSPLAQGDAPNRPQNRPQDPPRRARPPRSILGRLLDAEGPYALGSVVAELADGGVIDTRVLLAHRLGPDESAWPHPEDRFASDLLQPDAIHDGWLRALTESALAAPVPILLGGHSLLNAGLRALAPR